MTDFQNRQKALDAMATLSLYNAETPEPWLPDDLVNATVLLMNVAHSVAWFREDVELSFEQKCLLSEEFGKTLRQSILLFTGCDMKEMVKVEATP